MSNTLSINIYMDTHIKKIIKKKLFSFIIYIPIKFLFDNKISQLFKKIVKGITSFNIYLNHYLKRYKMHKC